MDMLTPSCFTGLEIDDPVFNEEFDTILEDDFQISSENGSPPSPLPLVVEERQQNPNVSNFDQPIPTMDLGDTSSQPCFDRGQLSYGVPKVRKSARKASSRTKETQSNFDHIVAERKRRKQLSQYFVALSAIVPGLKKMDKTSVLGDAVKYLTRLQEKVKTLEENARKQTIESLVLVNHSQLIIKDDNESCHSDVGGGSSNSLPEIEARICDKSILIRIHCEKHKGVMSKILSHIKEMNMSIISTSVSRFGTTGVYYTIITEMEQEFNVTLNDIVTSLRSVVRHARR